MRGFIMALGLALVVACGDDEHKGTISHGPSATASPHDVARTRLVYQPGSPLATAHVAAVFRKRLASIRRADIKIGGDVIHVDVANDQLDAAKAALDGGRVDLYLFDEKADPFAAKHEEHADKFTVETESVATADGSTSLRFLVAPKSGRAALLAYITPMAAGARPLVGPFAEGVRSYFAEEGRSVRGEQLASAKAEGDTLVLTFEGSGKNVLRWSSRARARYLLAIDGDVVGTSQPEAEVKDGVLRVPVSSGAATAAAKIDGRALSHETIFGKAEPLAPTPAAAPRQ
jgi:hypothetical protein